MFLKRVPFLPFDAGATHAVSLRAVLVTHNEADFTGYPGLMVENWTRGS
ncbi:MAG: hypothetical protein PHT19_05805 [Methylococcus sp.]|nr:hypothetical protein [Methylococcus sp.]